MAEETTVLDKYGVDVGFKLTYERVITEEDINLFAKVSGDYNPVHLDESHAAKTFFKGRIAHGALSQAFLSATMAKLPGLVIFMSQSLKFMNPVRIGDTITAIAEVTSVRKDKGIVNMRNTCVNQKGDTVVEGEASVRIFEKPE
ncbi:MAG: MaoC family dehydratase [Syntrophales bacterium]|nr:MaoC family dehydratase [Syntrophales bacterium]